MKAAVAGIFSSARSRFIGLRVAFRAVGGPLHLARRRGLELHALPLGRRNTILDCLPDRVVWVAHNLARLLRRLLGPLHRLAARELDRLAPQVVNLAPPRSGCDVCAGDQPDEPAQDEPAESAASA